VVVALLERNDYDTLLAKQQLDPHSFLYNYQRVYPQVGDLNPQSPTTPSSPLDVHND
jgi:hypothetical protein